MTGPSSSNHDILLSLLSSTKQMFELEHKDLDAAERERLWGRRAEELRSALFSSVAEISPVCNPSSKGSLSMARTQTAPPRRRVSMHRDATDTQMHAGEPMIRKRSYTDRKTAEQLFVSSSPGFADTKYLVDRKPPSFNSWSNGNPTKMQRIPSGQRKPVPQIQTPRYNSLDSASNSTSSSPLTGLPPSTFASPLPSSASFTFPGPTNTPREFQGYSFVHEMNRQSSLGGEFYEQVADITLASPADESRLSNRRASQAQFHESFEYEEIPQPFHEERGASASAIPIPGRRPSVGHARRHSSQGNVLRSRMAQQTPTIREQPSFASIKVSHMPSTSPRNIQPKPSAGSSASSSLSSSPLSSSSLPQQPVKVIDGNGKSTEKFALPKLERRKKLKEKSFFCKLCNKRPEGFRGAHELQRHTNAQHARVRKVWICVDGSPNRDRLKDCKHCQNQKPYPAYYNAAAHLRRIHFKPKAESGKKGAQQKKRAGTSGGREPKMEEIKKYWIKEIELVDGPEVEEEQPDFEMVDEEEIILETRDVAPMRSDKRSHGPTIRHSASEHMDARQADLARQAALQAELAMPNLSSTIDTAASSFSEEFITIRQEAPLDLEHHLTVSGLLSAASVAATTGSNEMQQSFCSDGADTLDGGLSVSQPNLDFSDLFQGLDAPLSPMPYGESDFQIL